MHADLSPDTDRPLRELLTAGRFREVLETYRALPESGTRQRPEVELIAATAATRLGEYTVGVALAESALQRFRSRADADGRMRATNLLGAIAFEHGRLDDASRAFAEALDLARQLGDTLMAAHASNNLASVAHLGNRPDEALSLFRTALLSYQRLGDRRGTAQTYHNLGLSFRQTSDWLDAEDSALQAMRIASQVGEGSLMALTVTGRAETHLARGELELAARDLERATELARTADDELGILDAGRLGAWLALANGKPAQAYDLAESARRKAQSLDSLQLRGECAAVAAIAARALGRTADAEARKAEALEIFARLGAERLRQDLERHWGMVN
jgi:hypothetical protein